MNTETKTLLDMLSKDDLETFLAKYELYRLSDLFESYCLNRIQSALSTVARRHFRESRVTGKEIAKLWMLAEVKYLLPIDDDLRALITRKIDAAVGTTDLKPAKGSQRLSTPIEKAHENSSELHGRLTADAIQDCSRVRRVAISTTFDIQAWPASMAFNCTRNLCDSSQEKAFLRALRLYFPAMFAYPNVALRSFINLDKIRPSPSDRLCQYSRSSRVDVLLCTHDEDPVAGFELDSAWHDGSDARSRDAMKNKLFQLSGIPLIRIRPENPGKVRAEDFYGLLIAEQGLNLVRPKRMNPTQESDSLKPDSARAMPF